MLFMCSLSPLLRLTPSCAFLPRAPSSQQHFPCFETVSPRCLKQAVLPSPLVRSWSLRNASRLFYLDYFSFSSLCLCCCFNYLRYLAHILDLQFLLCLLSISSYTQTVPRLHTFRWPIAVVEPRSIRLHITYSERKYSWRQNEVYHFDIGVGLHR